ncbi:pallilysin-related adhesin [Breznakiellaceae bacterium SP9]
MKRKGAGIFTACIFAAVSFAVFMLVLYPNKVFSAREQQPRSQTKIVSPGPELPQEGLSGAPLAQPASFHEAMPMKTNLDYGESLVSVITQNFDDDVYEEQIAAYRNLLENDNPIYVSYIKYDEASSAYKKLWAARTSVNQSGTFSMYVEDMVGDQGFCIVAGGMNSAGEHTLSVFRKNNAAQDSQPFDKIAEISIDGTITVQKTRRTQAYQLGIAGDKSYSIAAYGHDTSSENILDQKESIYTYNSLANVYEEGKITRIPGAQIEQQRLRELLSGRVAVFEDFLAGLWYYATPDSLIDREQYIYFDPANKELIFYGDDAQQVFTWQKSSSSRYGIYIASNNISITTLRRSIDIELESLTSIKVKVFEDVRLKLGVSAPWDGTYRKAPGIINQSAPAQAAIPYIDAVYDGALGKLRFSPDGSYELSANKTSSTGKYSFYRFDGRTLLELRDEAAQKTFLVEGKDAETLAAAKTLTLLPVRLGVQGVQDLHEGTLVLTGVNILSN